MGAGVKSGAVGDERMGVVVASGVAVSGSQPHPTLGSASGGGFNKPTKTGGGGGGGTPSLNSLIDTNFSFTKPPAKVTSKSFEASPKPGALVTTGVTGASSKSVAALTAVAVSAASASSPSKAEVLATVLDEETLRRKLRRFLGQQQADENLRFWDAVEAFTKDPEKKRATSARAIMSYFVVDTAPKQVNLKAETRAKLVALFKADDRVALADVHVFDEALREVFEDIRQSDGFQRFLETHGGGGGTTQNLTSPSDASLS